MYKAAASRLWVPQGSNRKLTRLASSSAVATKSSSSGGLFSWLTGDGHSSSPPLDVPLKDVSVPPPLPDYIEPGKTRITTLKNGLKIASETSRNPIASIGLYVDAGSVYETPEMFGTTQLLERMAFKSTTNRSHLRLVREVEAIGGVVMPTASREQMYYSCAALKTYLPQMVEVLIDSVRNAIFLDWEVTEQIEKLKMEVTETPSTNPQALLLEAIHSAGYTGALAIPLMAPEPALNSLNSAMLEHFVAENYTAPRMVLAASGVDHEELLKYAEPLLSDIPSVSRTKEPQSVYIGGDHRIHTGSELTNFALAFEIPCGWRSEKEAMVITVLQMLMGGGGSFSAGGPGKGMYSRLYLRVLNEHQQIQSFSAFSSIYNNSALFGIQATTGPNFVSEAVDIAVKELIAITNPVEVDKVQLDRAKQATKAAILMNMESIMVASEDVGKQVLTYGERKPVEHFLKYIDQISAKDIASVAKKLISGPLTMASNGNVIHVPSYESVRSKFSSK